MKEKIKSSRDILAQVLKSKNLDLIEAINNRERERERE
jgi:hypothetical protein